MIRCAFAAAALLAGSASWAREPEGLHAALDQLAREGKFSGAVVIQGTQGVRFARGYGLADPFAGRRFTPNTPSDSGSLAKPVTAAAVLMLARDGKLDLNAPVRRYLPEYPHPGATVAHLLNHSAGLPFDDSPEALTGKTNAGLLGDVASRRVAPLFAPGTAFSYCNLCYSTLALLIERITGNHYLKAAREPLRLPAAVSLRPQRLADWKGRAIGHRRALGGKFERFDSWEGEIFYGPANFSISTRQLADWGAEWWRSPLTSIRTATAPAMIAGKPSGLSWGNWYCSSDRRRCSYPGHHEGFHHNLYWNAERRISVAMMSNNTLAPVLQQRLQRAVVAFAERRPSEARRELSSPLPDRPVKAGRFRLTTGEIVVLAGEGRRITVERGGLRYAAILIGDGIRYVPGLDVYVAGARGGGLHWLSLYEDMIALPAPGSRG